MQTPARPRSAPWLQRPLFRHPFSDHLKVGHHHHVLVFEVVAVEDVLAAVTGEASCDTHIVSSTHKDGVLPTYVPRSGPTAVARDHLEVDQVQVDRVVLI